VCDYIASQIGRIELSHLFYNFADIIKRIDNGRQAAVPTEAIVEEIL
jgi:hypothetical protein